MKATIKHQHRKYTIDLHKAIDLSIPLRDGAQNPLAWLEETPKIEAVRSGDWVGKVAEGGSVNFNNIHFNPHAHGTHTECLGHITEEFYSINQQLKQYFFLAEVITMAPEPHEGDLVISMRQLKYALGQKKREAVIIRTLPNLPEKKKRKYLATNPPYMFGIAAAWLRDRGVKHVLLDVPSIDKEEDGGALAAHKAFWDVEESPRLDATITELIYVPNRVKDGTYLLNLQIAPFENDASPSKPIIYKLEDHDEN